MSRLIDLAGKRFGRVLVLSRSDKTNKKRSAYWNCLCDCGTEKVINGETLREGKTNSCGCLSKENFKTHGLSGHPLYYAHKSMLQRCLCPTLKSYPSYGGRGIVVCGRWVGEDGLSKFIEDMYPTFKKGLQLDRRDNDMGYSPENCRWVTHQQNQWNTGNQHNSRSKYKGVSAYRNSGKWVATIMKSGVSHRLGVFDTEDDAARAYNKVAKELFGEYAYQNKLPKYEEL